MPDSVETQELSELHYFETNPPPPTLAEHRRLTKDFIAYHVAQNRRVVLVSSGGTTVPLENQTVRFIDNFSAGTRGATSAEYFLEAGYAVIFLHRQFSLLPYSRHYSHSTNCFLDFLEEAFSTTTTIPTISSGANSNRRADQMETELGEPRIQVPQQYRTPMLTVLRKYRRAKAQNLLLLLPFTTITSYLFTLREVAMCMRPLGAMAMFYLAAAVSDFFVPPSRMVEHKIQSGEVPKELLAGGDSKAGEKAEGTAPPPAAEVKVKVIEEAPPAAPSSPSSSSLSPSGPQPSKPSGRVSQKLVIDLDPVPKFLKKLVDAWAPDAMIVSFKLETDPSLLLYKCRQSLDRYSHHLVIGNLLNTRKHEVVFVDHKGEQWIRLPSHRDHQQEQQPKGDLGKGRTIVEGEEEEIESIIIPECVKRHEELMMRKSVERVGRRAAEDAEAAGGAGR
ncbi:DNA/pantothenate metabolism flavoprotein [Peziza echinospora]|nr:DNA/pantothenate metabolism flavoprotein [Peziza echinospora]